MQLQKVITDVATMKPHQFTAATVTGWVSEIERLIWKEIICRYENTAVVEEYDPDTGELITDMPEPTAYSSTGDLETELIVDDAYASLYTFYVAAQIDLWNRDMNGYNNMMVLYNTKYNDFGDEYNRTHTPKGPRYISVF